jgi:hypothetical protein
MNWNLVGSILGRSSIKIAHLIPIRLQTWPPQTILVSEPSGVRGEDLKKSANQKQELPMAAMFVNESGQNEQSLERTFHRCFLPSFTSFGWGVSEEKIKMWKVNGRQTPSDGKSSHCLWQGELKKTFIL